MSIKEEVFAYLDRHRGEDVSGEQLAAQLQVSRNAVWKGIQALRSEGVEIDAATNRGYRLKEGSGVNRLSAEGIASYAMQLKKEQLEVWKEIDSTNRRAKELAIAGAAHGTAVIADSQTAGRGRLGRSFASPPGTGLYLSLLLRTNIEWKDAMLITTAAAAAVCNAIRRITGADAGIKWVNDIYIGKRKICGILTEAITDIESGGLDSVVVGIGVNFLSAPEAYPAELLERIGWLYDSEETPISRNQLAAAILEEVLQTCGQMKSRAFLDDYRAHAIMLNRDVRCIRGNDTWEAHTVDIDEDGGLIVRLPDGTLQTLNSGEISIRW